MNFRGILSKSSLKSSSSGKSITHSEEISKLQNEIDSLKQTIDSLKNIVESRDTAIGTLAREKEKINCELKTAQRTNRNLHQQLVDERDIHSKEKDFLINEIKRLSVRSEQRISPRENDNEQGDASNSVFNELKAKDKIIFNIGAKYLKIKSSKTTLQKKLEKMQVQNKKVCENIMILLQDNRKTLDNLLDNLLKSATVSPNCKKYLNLLQINANLHYENTQLKISLTAKNSNSVLSEPNDRQVQLEKVCSKEKKPANKERRNIKERTVEGRCYATHSKIKSVTCHNCPELRYFKYNHLMLDPRGTFHRSASDSCITRTNMSELMNVNIIN